MGVKKYWRKCRC